MASRLYQEGKHTWRFAVSSGSTLEVDPTTQLPRRRYRQKWIRVKAKSLKEAQAKQAEILAQIARGTYVEPCKLTLKEFVEQHFLPHLRAKERSPETVGSYGRIFRLHIEPVLGHMQIGQIAPLHVEQWMNTLRRAERSKPGATSDEAIPALGTSSIKGSPDEVWNSPGDQGACPQESRKNLQELVARYRTTW